MSTPATSSGGEATDDFDYLFKIVLIGDAGVGKTAIVHRFKYNTFVERHASTIGVDFTLKTMPVDDKKIKLQIWDTAGQERFRTITQSYYRSANCVVLCYDITKHESFDNLHKWLEDVERYSGNCIFKMVVGNKCDLENARQVSQDDAKKFSEHFNIGDTMETSAKDNSNIEEAFWRMAKHLKDKYENEENQLRAGHQPDIVLDSKSVGGSTCCR